MTLTIVLLVIASAPDAGEGSVSGSDEALCEGIDLDERRRKLCEAGALALRKRIQKNDLVGAFEVLGKLNDSLSLFRPYEGRCWGTLNGGACTPEQERGLRNRELYGNPDALAPRWAAWAGLIAMVSVARRDQIELHHQAVKDALAKPDVEAATAEFAKTVPLGDDDEKFATELREAQFAAQAKRMLEGQPAFEEGGVRWFSVPIYNPRIVPVGNKCKKLFGDRADRSALSARDDRVRCSLSESRPLTDEELAAAREALQREEKRPPTNRRPTSEVWSAAVPVTGDTLACPGGMQLKRFVDSKAVDRCLDFRRESRRETDDERWANCKKSDPPKVSLECEAFMSKDDYCPSWKFDGRICLVEKCLDGTSPLAEQSDNLLRGCYRCPVGEIDLVQSAAAEGQDWARLKEGRRQYPFQTLYCRVVPEGHARKTAQPTKEEQREKARQEKLSAAAERQRAIAQRSEALKSLCDLGAEHTQDLQEISARMADDCGGSCMSPDAIQCCQNYERQKVTATQRYEGRMARFRDRAEKDLGRKLAGTDCCDAVPSRYRLLGKNCLPYR